MGMFDKKNCDICGEKIGLLGNRKLEDGNLCKDCAKKLSPFFSDRRRSTVEDIRQQLAAREANKEELKAFSPTQVFGGHTKVYIDRGMGKFCVSRRSDYREENADLIALSAVTNARYEVEEHRSEQYTKDANGNQVSFNPPRYDYTYEMTLYIDVNHPYINEISFEVTDIRPDSRYSEAFRAYEQTANEIVAALRGTAMPYGAPVAPGTNGAGIPYNANPMYAGVPGAVAYQNQAVQQPYPQGTVFPAGYQPGYGQPPVQPPYGQPPVQQGYQQPYGQPQPPYGQPPVQQGFQQPVQQTGPVWFCPNCGTQNAGNFCLNCGTPKQG